MKKKKLLIVFNLIFTSLTGINAQVDPDTAQKASIDRFSMEAGNLFVRDDMNGLPGPNEPIDFDIEPFITKGLGDGGELIAYYNFDVMSIEPAPIYVLIREGESSPVEGQLNIIDVIPGDTGYNDFWQVNMVTVPANYIANTITSMEEITLGSFSIQATDILVNCPVVPEGSTAKWRLKGENPGLTRGWYRGMVVYYFNFSEKALAAVSGMVPVSPIYVTFYINPDQPGGGPPSGFVSEELTGRTHNVVSTLPEDEGYSPLWSVNVYDNTDFENVSDLQSATMANILAIGVANVNCPIAATYTEVDRFNEAAGSLFVRDTTNGFPDPNEPIDFDIEPFITHGLGPNGELVSYYNFDVMPIEPAPIYVLIREGESNPVAGQMNIINVIPGDEGYNDFWKVHMVTVPADYAANTITNAEEIISAGYMIDTMDLIVNCPVVPEGSTAELRLTDESSDLTLGWYKSQVVYYFNFSEKELMATDEDGTVPLSPIYVTFNINPDQPGGGPPSGFRTDENDRTHNVVSTLPENESYSPLWSVNVYDNEDFENVFNLQSAMTANILAVGVDNVNCPIVRIEPATSVKNDPGLPIKYSLVQNFPNPFNPSTVIKFSIVDLEKVSLIIYNSLGQEVAVLVNDVLHPGNYSVEWDAVNIASGVYFYTLTASNFKDTKKMVLLR